MTASEVDIALAARLRALRMKRGMTQAQLGRATGMTYQQVQKYELARNLPRATHLLAFAEALQVSPFFLLSGDAGLPETETAAEQWHKLVIEFSTLPSTQAREAAISIVRALNEASTRKKESE
jgi:transcriptional regulator with XRE-family HTH domain